MQITAYSCPNARPPPIYPNRNTSPPPHSLLTVMILRYSAPLATAFPSFLGTLSSCSLHSGPSIMSSSQVAPCAPFRFTVFHTVHRRITVRSSLSCVYVPHYTLCSCMELRLLAVRRSRLYIPVAKAPSMWLAQPFGLLASTYGVSSSMYWLLLRVVGGVRKIQVAAEWFRVQEARESTSSGVLYSMRSVHRQVRVI